MTVQVDDLIATYLKNEDKENANKFESYTKLRGFVADKYIKEWVLNEIYPKDIREAHENGDFHIHDLADGLVAYCKGHDATKLLVKGLITQTVIAGPAQHLSTFFDHCVNMIAYNQQHWAGAQAIANLNTLASPFVEKYRQYLISLGISNSLIEKGVFRYIKQCVQSFIYNLNFPSRAGSQTPFSNITLNFNCPSNMRDEPCLVPGINGTWGDYERDGLLILEAFNDVYLSGDKGGRPFTFPIPTINLMPDTDYEHPLWQELMRSVAKFGTYSFMNYDGSGIDPNTILSMCCRLQLDLSQLAPTGGRWAYAGETGSLGVVTLNMGRLGYLSKGRSDFLYRRLDELLDKARRSLIMKGLFIEQHKERFMPFDVEYGTDLSRFFRTIGIIGLNEMCMNMYGTPLSENIDFVKAVLWYIREWTRKTQKETGVLWNLEMTPAEGSATRMATIDKEKFPHIFTQGKEGAYYYTAMITPPNEEMGMLERIIVEQEILKLFTGGTVHRIYIGERAPSTVAIGKLIQRIAQRTELAYFDIAPSYSICPDDGTYEYGPVKNCHVCDAEMLIYDRIVGYYRPRQQANSGKLQEIRDRLQNFNM